MKIVLAVIGFMAMAFGGFGLLVVASGDGNTDVYTTCTTVPNSGGSPGSVETCSGEDATSEAVGKGLLGGCLVIAGAVLCVPSGIDLGQRRGAVAPPTTWSGPPPGGPGGPAGPAGPPPAPHA